MHTRHWQSRRIPFLELLTRASYAELLLLWLIVNVGFGLLYFSLSSWHLAHSPTLLEDMPLWHRFWNSMYFSIVTATTTGYGDIVPQGLSKVFAGGQSILAFLIFGILITKLVSTRQDVMLKEVHRMTFEGIFYHIRHVLFIVRKDLDHIIHVVEREKTMTDRDWDTLATAFLQAQSLIEEIPDLYNDNGHDLRIIDLKREQLLFEAIHRTLDRTEQLLTLLKTHGIDWTEQKQTAAQIRAFVRVIDTIIPLWKQRSPYHETEAFEDILTLGGELHARLKDVTGQN